MKKIIFKSAAVALLLLLFAALFACGDNTEADKSYKVMVAVTEGITVRGENPKTVADGESVSFEVEIADGYAFDSVSHGSYNEQTGVLTIDGVTERITVKFELTSLGYDTGTEYNFVFRGTEKDSASVESGTVNAGTKITLTAADTKRIFLGWSFGASYSAGGEIISEERSYTFRLSPDLVTDGVLTAFANYADSNVYYYDPNGGYLDSTTRNMEENIYYEAGAEGNKVKVTLLQHYTDFAESASTFWDDGTFYRPGYVLREYNTAPDGTGEPYSLGSKFFPVVNGAAPTLYCIWEEAEPEADFTVESVYMANPTTAAYAPDWCESGVIITSYLGDDETVCIPEQIGGKAVIAISAGAFTGKSVKTLVLPKTIQKIEDGAFVGCTCLKNLYYPNSIYEISDAAFDAATYEGFTTLIVNATMAPRYSRSTDGAFAVKLSRVLAARDEKKIIVISGSSTYQGLATEYMEALFDGEYTVINFGTTRPRPGLFYLEALSHYTDEDDVFVYAPENSAFMMGERYLSWRLLRDLEGMNNLFRYVDISNYEGYFSSFAELNRGYNYTSPERKYEEMVENGGKTKDGVWYGTDKNGDYQHTNRQGYLGKAAYVDAYFITLNNRYKSINDIDWNKVEEQTQNKDYTDPSNPTWTSIDRPELVWQMNMAIGKAQASGARVYFGFCPVDAAEVVPEAQNPEWFAAYDKLIDDLYCFDGSLGSCADYTYASKYFYDCAFHVNDYGRVYRTYMLYADICAAIGITQSNGIYSVGTDFDGCLFEDGSDGTPITGVDYLN